jgi:hypothetical protein
MVDLVGLGSIAQGKFSDIVVGVHRIDAKLRMILIDGSYVDLWWSEIQEGRFAHHWNRRHLDGTVYRLIATTTRRIGNGSISRPFHSATTGSMSTV